MQPWLWPALRWPYGDVSLIPWLAFRSVFSPGHTPFEPGADAFDHITSVSG